MKQAKPTKSGNKRVWIECKCGRKLTVRASKVKGWSCGKCGFTPAQN